MKATPLRILFSLLLATCATVAQAQEPSELPDGTDIKGAAEHPSIPRFDGSNIRFYEKRPSTSW